VLAVLVALAGPAAAHENAPAEADAVFDILTVVIDAPWRVQVRPGVAAQIPVLVFFPETKDRWRRIQVLRVRLSDATGGGEQPIYEDALGSGPRVWTSVATGLTGEGAKLQDAWGRTTGELSLISPVEPPAGQGASFRVCEVGDHNRSWHVILRIPVPAPIAARRTRVVLVGQVDYRRLAEGDQAVHSMKRRLEVVGPGGDDAGG
jgi:hypothetical protein